MISDKLNREIVKASEIMSRYRVSREDQITVVRVLIDAGVEKCLDEQQRIREDNAALVAAACGLPN